MNHEVHQTVRTVFAGTLWRALRYPFIFLSFVLVPRVMGTADVYGQYALFFSVYTVCEAFIGMGNIQIFGRFMPEYKPGEEARAHRLLRGVLVYHTLVTLAIIAVVSAILIVARPEAFPLRWLWVLALVLLLGKLQGTLFAYIYGKNEIGRFSSRDLLRSIFQLVFTVGFYLLFGLDGALWSFVATQLVLTLVSVGWTHRHVFTRVGPLSFREFKPYLVFGLTFHIPIALMAVLQRSGNMVIQGITHRPDQVSYYHLANEFFTLTGTFLGLILTTLIPSLARLHARNEKSRAREWLRMALTYCGVVAFLVYNGLGFLGQPALRIFIPGFEGAFPNAMVMALALAPLLITDVGTNLAVLEKQPGVYVASVFTGVAAMLGASVLLVPRWGGVGASWATVAGHGVMALVFWWKYRAVFAHILKDFLIAIGIGALVAPLYFVECSLPLRIAGFVLTSAAYLGVLALLGKVQIRHLSEMMAALRAGGGVRAGPPAT